MTPWNWAKFTGNRRNHYGFVYSCYVASVKRSAQFAHGSNNATVVQFSVKINLAFEFSQNSDSYAESTSLCSLRFPFIRFAYLLKDILICLPGSGMCAIWFGGRITVNVCDLFTSSVEKSYHIALSNQSNSSSYILCVVLGTGLPFISHSKVVSNPHKSLMPRTSSQIYQLLSKQFSIASHHWQRILIDP